MVRSRDDGTTVRILPKTVQMPKRTVIKQMCLKNMAKEVKKGHCELFMARLNTSKKNCEQPTQENILSAEKLNKTLEFKELIDEFSYVFLQELPDELPPSRAFKFWKETDPTKGPFQGQ